MKRKNQKRPTFARVAPRKFVIPMPKASPKKRTSIARFIAEKKRVRLEATASSKDVVPPPPASVVLLHALDDTTDQRARVRKQVQASRTRLGKLQDERRRLMALLVSVANGASRFTVESLAAQAAAKQQSQAGRSSAMTASAQDASTSTTAATAAAATTTASPTKRSGRGGGKPKHSTRPGRRP